MKPNTNTYFKKLATNIGIQQRYIFSPDNIMLEYFIVKGKV